MKIGSVYLFENDMCMVFDQNGEQIAELQHPYCADRLSILELADDSTLFFTGQL